MVHVTASCVLSAAAMLILSVDAVGWTSGRPPGHRLDVLSAPSSDRETPAVVVAQADTGMFSRQTWREAQRALNHFGHDAGTPDGLPGRKTGAAIRGYQAEMGEIPTGELGRAAMGLLLERYRNDLKRSEAPRQSGPRLPAVTSERASSGAESAATVPEEGAGQSAANEERTAALGAASVYDRYLKLELPVSVTGNWLRFQFQPASAISIFMQNGMLGRPIHDLIYYIVTPKQGGGHAIADSNEADPLFVDAQVTHTWATGLKRIPEGSLVCWQFDPREGDFRVFDMLMLVPKLSSPLGTSRNFGGMADLRRRDPVAARLTADRMPCRALLDGADPAPPDPSSREKDSEMLSEVEPKVTVVDKMAYARDFMGMTSEPSWMVTLQNNSDIVAREMRFAIHSETESGLNLLATWEPEETYIDALEGAVVLIESDPPKDTVIACIEHLTADGSRRTVTIVPMEGAPASGTAREFRPRAPSQVDQTDRQSACSDPAYLSQIP